MKTLSAKKKAFILLAMIFISAILMNNPNTPAKVIPLWELQKEVNRKSLPPYMGRTDDSSPNPASGVHGHAH